MLLFRTSKTVVKDRFLFASCLECFNGRIPFGSCPEWFVKKVLFGFYRKRFVKEQGHVCSASSKTVSFWGPCSRFSGMQRAAAFSTFYLNCDF